MRAWQRLDRLVVRLVATTVVAGLIAASVGAVLVWAQARSAVREEIATRAASVAESLALGLDNQIEGLANTLRIAATVPAIAATAPDARADLRAVLAAAPTFDELFLVDSDGHVVAAAAARFLAEPSDYGTRGDLIDLEDEQTPVQFIDQYPPVLEIAVPVESPPGQVTGALVARMPLELVAPYITQPDATTDAVAFLVDGDGRYLVHPSRDLVARGERFPATWASAQTTQELTLEEGGRAWIVGLAPSLHLPAAVVVQRAEDDALATVTRQLTQLGLTVFVVIGATVAGVGLAGQRLLRPLDRVSDAVGRLERGERGVRVEVAATGEIGALTRQLNGMASAVDRRAEEVAQMHHLSLLLTSRADRGQVGEQLVSGARALLEAKTAAFFAVDERDELDLLALDGISSDTERLQAAAESSVAKVRDGKSEPGQAAPEILTLPIKGLGEELRGVIAIVGGEQALSEEDVRLAEAYASFAGTTLENVQRLEYERALVAELEEAIEQRRELMGRVSHDLRVPIICIESFGDRLLRDGESLAAGVRQQLANSIVEQGQILDDLVTTLLEYSVPMRSMRPVSLAPISVRPVVASALDAVAGLISERPVETQIEDFEVEADATLLARALNHLLSNALRFSPPGSPVRLVTRSDGRQGRIQVGDEGMGLAEEEIGKVFEPFWRRVVEGQDQGGAGLGLGLTLVAEYLRAMGGSVEVETEPGRGSTFTLTIPLAQTEPSQYSAMRMAKRD